MSFAGSAVYNRFRKGWRTLHDGNAMHLQGLQDKDYSALTSEEMRLLLVQFTQMDEDQMSDMDSDDLRIALKDEVGKDVEARLGAPQASASGVRTRSAGRRTRPAKQPQPAQASSVSGEEMSQDEHHSDGDGDASDAGPADPLRAARRAPPRHESDSTATDSDEEAGHAADQLVPLAGSKRKRAGGRQASATAKAVAANAAGIAELKAQISALSQTLTVGLAALSRSGAQASPARAAPDSASPGAREVRSTKREKSQANKKSKKKSAGKCERERHSTEVNEPSLSAMSASSPGGLPLLVRTMLHAVKRRMKAKAISRVTPEKIAEDWLGAQPAGWGGMVRKLSKFQTAERLDNCEPWYQLTSAEDACLALPELITGYVHQLVTPAALARVRRVARKKGKAWVLLPAEPAYVALVCACIKEGSTGHSQYRIVPGQVEELERSRYDPVLLRATYPLSVGGFQDIFVDALKLLESMVALGAEAMLQQASALVLLYAVANQARAVLSGKEGERALELFLRRVLFEYRVTAVTAADASLLKRMGTKAEDYKAWQRSHGGHGASCESSDAGYHARWQYRAPKATGPSQEHPKSPPPKSADKAE